MIFPREQNKFSYLILGDRAWVQITPLELVMTVY